MGDILWIEPVVRYFAERKKKVTVISDFPELFENYPYKNVTAVKQIDKKKRYLLTFFSFFKKDLFINLKNSYEKKPKQHILTSYQQVAGMPLVEATPKLYLSEKEKKSYTHLGSYIVIHLESFSSSNHRNVYGIDWQVIVDYLVKRRYKVVIVGKQHIGLNNVEHFQTSIRELISLIYAAKLFIGIDSGPSHLATAMKVPSIVFFGSVNPWYRHFKDLSNITILQNHCQFAGCYHDVVNSEKGVTCRVVGEEGVPPCSLHTNVDVINAIDELLLTDTF